MDPFDFDDSKTTWPDQICQELEPLLKDLFSEGGPFLNDMYKPGPAKFPPRTMRRVADWVRFRYPGIADLIPDNRWQKFVEGLAWEYRMNGIF
ncbi:MAG: hypothetical protein JST38_12830 [Bacteroidetes bacterium]|nr:hypothetical protein [Bacteroidota bacterium]